VTLAVENAYAIRRRTLTLGDEVVGLDTPDGLGEHFAGIHIKSSGEAGGARRRYSKKRRAARPGRLGGMLGRADRRGGLLVDCEHQGVVRAPRPAACVAADAAELTYARRQAAARRMVGQRDRSPAFGEVRLRSRRRRSPCSSIRAKANDSGQPIADSPTHRLATPTASRTRSGTRC